MQISNQKVRLNYFWEITKKLTTCVVFAIFFFYEPWENRLMYVGTKRKNQINKNTKNKLENLLTWRFVSTISGFFRSTISETKTYTAGWEAWKQHNLSNCHEWLSNFSEEICLVDSAICTP